MDQKRKLSRVHKLTIAAALSALAAVLMLFEIPLVFVAPDFYKLDFSEVPVLIGTFVLGPVYGVVIEFIKVALNFALNGTITGGIGELANFLVGCALVLPAGFIYRHKKSRVSAALGMAAGTVVMAVFGVALNALLLIPAYSKLMPLEAIISAGHAIVPAIRGVWTFAVYCVAPFNLLKGVIVGAVTFVLYLPLARALRGAGLQS